MNAIVLRGDARRLPLPDASVDLICTSPPYFGLRSYTDGGEHYEGQIGSEATPAEWVAALVECTREWMRVLKPQGSMFVNLGDKYAGSGMGGNTSLANSTEYLAGRAKTYEPGRRKRIDARDKSLLGLPWRYALACTDQLGLILRRDIIWAKPNGLPESVTDRCRSSHEYLFHLVKQPRYYAAVDEIREPHTWGREINPEWREARKQWGAGSQGRPQKNDSFASMNPLGKLPGSVWSIPSQPLTVPPHLGVDHFAAFPMELPRRCVLGWSPPGVCVACGEGRRPVVVPARLSVNGERLAAGRNSRDTYSAMRGGDSGIRHHQNLSGTERARLMDPATITGYACACTPHTDHPGTGEDGGPHGPSGRSNVTSSGIYPGTGENWGGKQHLSDRPKVGPRREYHFDGWAPPPTRPAVVLDPFGGTGTTALVASMHGRIGVSVDRSADYTRLARWRCTDPGERAKALQVPKPPPVPDGQDALFDLA